MLPRATCALSRLLRGACGMSRCHLRSTDFLCARWAALTVKYLVRKAPGPPERAVYLARYARGWRMLRQRRTMAELEAEGLLCQDG